MKNKAFIMLLLVRFAREDRERCVTRNIERKILKWLRKKEMNRRRGGRREREREI